MDIHVQSRSCCCCHSVSCYTLWVGGWLQVCMSSISTHHAQLFILWLDLGPRKIASQDCNRIHIILKRITTSFWCMYDTRNMLDPCCGGPHLSCKSTLCVRSQPLKASPLHCWLLCQVCQLCVKKSGVHSR